jgi:hypothetical protein
LKQADNDVSPSVQTDEGLEMQQDSDANDGDTTIRMSVFQIQPVPIRTLVGRLNGVTAITRIWDDGDHLKCRLCLACDASNEGVCTIQTTAVVPDSEAELYLSRGLRDEIAFDLISVGAN